jgi:hypothetical protein
MSKQGLLKIQTAQQHRQINAADARRQGEAVYLILRAAGNEADIVFLTNEKTVLFNNPLRV